MHSDQAWVIPWKTHWREYTCRKKAFSRKPLTPCTLAQPVNRYVTTSATQ